jgi:hypothetical protein
MNLTEPSYISDKTSLLPVEQEEPHPEPFPITDLSIPKSSGSLAEVLSRLVPNRPIQVELNCHPYCLKTQKVKTVKEFRNYTL